jgi:hypothetical protein
MEIDGARQATADLSEAIGLKSSTKEHGHKMLPGAISFQ